MRSVAITPLSWSVFTILLSKEHRCNVGLPGYAVGEFQVCRRHLIVDRLDETSS